MESLATHPRLILLFSLSRKSSFALNLLLSRIPVSKRTGLSSNWRDSSRECSEIRESLDRSRDVTFVIILFVEILFDNLEFLSSDKM